MTASDADNEAYFTARYAEARTIFPVLSYPTFTHNPAGAITTEELNVAGIAVFNLPPGTDVPATDVANHTCKHEAGHAYLRRLERATGIPRTVYVEQFRVRFGYPTDYAVTNYSAGYVSIGEAWAEAFCNACEGRLVTSKSHLDELVDPLVARAWFQALDPAQVVVAPPPITPQPQPDLSGKGCDIASFQGTVNFDLLKTEVSFVIAKASEGTGYRDPTFSRNWSEAKRVGLRRGAYHFARPDLGLNAQDEATYFLSTITPVDPGDLLALDYEVNWNGDVPGWCKAWLDIVSMMTGTKPLIYLNLSLVRNHNWAQVIAAGYPLWLASYDGQPDTVPSTPWPSVAMKQWTSDGQLAGVPSPRVDLNTAYGGEDMTRDEVIALIEEKWGLTNTIKAIKDAYDPLVPLAHAKSHKHDATVSEPK